jgi:hypothetical protein
MVIYDLFFGRWWCEIDDWPKNGSWIECFCNNFLHGQLISLTPALVPKGAGAFSLLLEGQGLGRRGSGIYIMKQPPFLGLIVSSVRLDSCMIKKMMNLAPLLAFKEGPGVVF